MPGLMSALKNDPRFRSLSPTAQMDYAYRQFSNLLQGDPRFRSMSPLAQRNYLKQQAMYAVTFDDPERERQFTQMAVDVLQGQSGATGKMQGYEFWQSTIKNAGTIGLAEDRKSVV